MTVEPAGMFRSPLKRNWATHPLSMYDTKNCVPLKVPPLPTPLIVAADESIVIVSGDSVVGPGMLPNAGTLPLGRNVSVATTLVSSSVPSDHDTSASAVNDAGSAKLVKPPG